MRQIHCNFVAGILPLLACLNFVSVNAYDIPNTSPPWNVSVPIDFPWKPVVYTNDGIEWTQNYTCRDTPHGFNLGNPARCGTSDGLDYYGFGVRLGFYFNWAASFVANNFIPGEIPGAVDANSIFLLALEVSILRGTLTGEFRKVDAMIMNLIGVGTTVGTMSLWGYRTCRYRRSGREGLKFYGGFGTYSRLLLCICANVYWLWFWRFPASHKLGIETCDPRCQAAWVMGHMISSGIHWLFFSFGVVFMLYWGAMIPGLVLTPYVRLRNWWHARKARDYARTTKVTLETGLSKAQLTTVSYTYALLNALWIVFVIIIIEITLNENSIRAALAQSSANTSPSQLIPFLIGLVTFLRIIYIGHATRRYGDGRIEATLPEREEYMDVVSEEVDDTTTLKPDSPEATKPQRVSTSATSAVTLQNEKDSGSDPYARFAPFRGVAKTLDKWLLSYSPAYEKFSAQPAQKPTVEPPGERPFRGLPAWRAILRTWLPWITLLDQISGTNKME